MSIQNYCLCCGTALACIKCNVARAPSAAPAQEDCPACDGVGDMFGGFACDQCGGTGKQSTRDSAAARVQAFVDAFENRRGLDPEEIYSLGTADEPLVLTVADLRALLRT
jgi:RecJ-like exonuclease